MDNSIYEIILNPTTEEGYLRLPPLSHRLQLMVKDGIKTKYSTIATFQEDS